MPLTQRTNKAALAGLLANECRFSDIGAIEDYPFIIRPIGSHAGHDLMKIDTENALREYLEKVDSEKFYVSKFVDYRSSDGLFRKYRVVLIEGKHS